MKFIIRFVIVVLAIMALPYFVPGIAVSGFYAALMTAIVFGLINLVIRPIISVVTIPINVFTLGIFGLVVNALLLWFVASFVDGFAIANFSAAFWGAIAISFVNWLVSKF